MATERPDVLDIVHMCAKKGTLLSSCKTEVKELMNQIDILLTNQYEGNQKEKELLRDQVQARDKEIISLRVTVKEKSAQIKKLQNELSKLEHKLKVKTSDCETQLLRMRSELSRLRKSYEKLKTGRLRNSVHVVDDNTRVLTETIQNLQEQLEVCQRELDTKTELLDRLSGTQQDEKSIEDKDILVTESHKKIAGLKKERDSAREQTKNSLIETDRWYNQAMKLSSINKELESRITTLSIQINTIQESMKGSEKRDDEVTRLKEEIAEKDSKMKQLEEEYSLKLHSEEMYHRQELQTLQMTLKTLTMDENRLKEENTSLKKRIEHHDGPSLQNNLKKQLDKREKELDECKQELKLKESLLTSSEEQINHLEELLTEATSQANSSTRSISDGGGGMSSTVSSVMDYNEKKDDSHTAVLLANFQDKVSSIMSSRFAHTLDTV